MLPKELFTVKNHKYAQIKPHLNSCEYPLINYLVSPKAELTTSFSVTETLNRIDQKIDEETDQSLPQGQSETVKNSQEQSSKNKTENGQNGAGVFHTRQRNAGTRQSKLVRQKKVDHR